MSDLCIYDLKKNLKKTFAWNTLCDMVSTYQKHERQMWLLKFPTFFQAIPKTCVRNNLSTNNTFHIKMDSLSRF